MIGNEEKVVRIVKLLNDILRDVYVQLDVTRAWFADAYMIKLSWQNGAHSTSRAFCGNMIVKNSGEVLVDFIKEETGYDIHGVFTDFGSCEKQNKVNKVNKVNEVDKEQIENPKHYIEDERVNHPEHYTKGGIEVHDFISAWRMDFDSGNIIKYVTRAPYKNNKLEDLKKARWYLNKLIEGAEEEKKHER